MRDCGWTPLSQKPTLAVKGADISRLLSQWASCYSQFTEKPWHSIFPFSGPHPAKQQENEKMVVEEEEEEKAPGKMKMGGAIWNTSSNECWQVKETDGCRIRSPMCLKHGKSLWPFFLLFFLTWPSPVFTWLSPVWQNDCWRVYNVLTHFVWNRNN